MANDPRDVEGPAGPMLPALPEFVRIPLPQTTGRVVLDRATQIGWTQLAGRTTALKILVLLVSSTLSLLAAEGFLRFFSKYSGQAYSVNPTGSQYKFYKFDPVLGWANAPGMRGTYSRDEFTYPIEVNAFAMRQGPVSLKPSGDRPRIAVLGDSYVWGIGVSDEQRLTERLAEALDAEVLNFGVAGYGPIQYELMLDRVLEFEPDLVVLVFCLANDWGDNVLFDRYGYFKPYAMLEEPDGFSIEGYPLPNVDDFGFAEPETGSVLVHMLVSAFSRGLGRPAQQGLVSFQDGMPYHLEALSDAERQTVTDAVEVNARLLASIDGRIRSAGVPWLIAPAPTKCEYSPTCENDNSVRREDSLRLLEQAAAGIGVPVLDTVAAMDGTHFWEKDGHWNPDGHVIMASEIARYVTGSGILSH